MALVDIKIVNNNSFMPEVSRMLNEAVKETAKELRDEIRDKISIKFPPASKPGNPPRMRSGGTRRAIFAKKIRSFEWAVGVNKVGTRMTGVGKRENLGIWLELGTGKYRKPFPRGSKGSITGQYASPGEGKRSMEARPFLLDTVVKRGPDIARSKFTKRKGGLFSFMSFFSR